MLVLNSLLLLLLRPGVGVDCADVRAQCSHLRGEGGVLWNESKVSRVETGAISRRVYGLGLVWLRGPGRAGADAVSSSRESAVQLVDSR